MRIDRPRDDADEPNRPTRQSQSPEHWGGPRQLTPEQRQAEFDALQKLADEEEAQYAKQKAESAGPLTRTEHREQVRDLDDRDQADLEPESARPEAGQNDGPLSPTSDLGLPYISRAAHREEIAASPQGEVETAKDESVVAHSGRDDAPAADTEAEARQWQTITEEIGEARSWPSCKSAKRELGTVPGTELHHIVEQSQQKPTRSGFTAEQINHSDNLTRQPIEVHQNISARYSRGIPGFSHMRDSLNEEPWEYQHDFGRRVIDEETRRARREDD